MFPVWTSTESERNSKHWCWLGERKNVWPVKALSRGSLLEKVEEGKQLARLTWKTTEVVDILC